MSVSDLRGFRAIDRLYPLNDAPFNRAKFRKIFNPFD